MDENHLKPDLATLTALLRGNLSLGATFWVGLIVADLTVAMLYVWVSAILAVSAEGARPLIGALAQGGLLLAALFMAAILPAMIRAARANTTAGGYRRAAVLIALAHVAVYAGLVWRAFAG